MGKVTRAASGFKCSSGKVRRDGKTLWIRVWSFDFAQDDGD
jgi:hypothetical protein